MKVKVKLGKPLRSAGKLMPMYPAATQNFIFTAIAGCLDCFLLVF